jgi:hypothetical protein
MISSALTGTQAFNQALIVKKEWLTEFYSLRKGWEMRARPTKKRGTYGFIESKSGLVTGQFDLVDSLEAITASEYPKYFDMHRIPKELKDLYVKYPYPWVISNVIKFDEPIKYTHPPGAMIWVNL